MGDISNFIQSIAKKEEVLQTYAAQVIHINREANSLHSDQDAYTVEVMRADGAIIKNVRLKASIQDKEEGVLLIPKKDSWVLVSVIEGVETRAFISQYAEVERTFVRFKNDDNEYLEIDSSASTLAMHFKKATTNNTEAVGEETAPEYNSIAKIEFNSLGSSESSESEEGATEEASTEESENPKPSLITSFYDENGKEVSKSTFTGTTQETVLNTVSSDEVKERVKLNLSSEEDTSVSLVFTDEEGEEKQKLTFNESQTEIFLKEGDNSTKFNLKVNDVLLSTHQGDAVGYQTTIKHGDIMFNKDSLTFKMDDKFTICANEKNLLTELETLISEVSKIIVVQGTSPNVGALNTIKSNLGNLLKS